MAFTLDRFDFGEEPQFQLFLRCVFGYDRVYAVNEFVGGVM